VARIPRRYLVDENTVNHCSWRSHNHSFVFATDEERAKFLELLGEHKEKYGVRILSYCLMGTHPHVVSVATQGQAALSSFWQVVNGRYARWFNARHGRRGQVVMDRFSSPLIQDERHLLRTMRYGDQNPVKAGLVRSAARWRWSSHRHYALGEPNDLIDDAPAFLNLGRTAVERRLAYRHLFSASLTSAQDGCEQMVTCLFIGDTPWVNDRLQALGKRRRCLDPPAVDSLET
jgi:putative transposase